jgi:hypothetical protein
MKTIAAKICEWIGLPGAVILALLAAACWLVLGCSTDKQPGSLGGEGNTAPTAKSGAELWAENCVRCHNIRSPSSYSPAQWEVVMMHMRVRANLTPEEHKKILEFLKSGS